MPWRPINPELAILFSNNDSVVAQNFGPGFLIPDFCQGAFTGSGFTDKQNAFPFVINTSGMNDHTVDLRQIVQHQEFDDRAKKWIVK
jgi:hypothetical protein